MERSIVSEEVRYLFFCESLGQSICENCERVCWARVYLIINVICKRNGASWRVASEGDCLCWMMMKTCFWQIEIVFINKNRPIWLKSLEIWSKNSIQSSDYLWRFKKYIYTVVVCKVGAFRKLFEWAWNDPSIMPFTLWGLHQVVSKSQLFWDSDHFLLNFFL